MLYSSMNKPAAPLLQNIGHSRLSKTTGGWSCHLMLRSETIGRSGQMEFFFPPTRTQAMKSIVSFAVAALFGGASSWAGLLAESNPSPLLEIVQLGGTGGMILVLIYAVITLWRALAAAKDDERVMRKEHAEYITSLHDKHSDELNKTIENLRQENADLVHAERVRADETYQPRNE